MTPGRLARVVLGGALVVGGVVSLTACRGTAPAPTTTAVLTVSRASTMRGESHLWDYASAMFVDSTRGAPEAGYWRVPAGDVRLIAGAETLDLPAGTNPVSGTAYFAPHSSVHYVAGETYTMTASGSDSVGAFRVQVVAPPQPHVTAPAMNDTLARGQDLVVTWDPGAPGDSVTVDLMPHSPEGTPRLLLRVPDTGRHVFPAAAIADCPSDYVTMITVTRTRETPVVATGVRGGAFRAIASDYVHVSFRPRAR